MDVVIDTSALIAAIVNEPERKRIIEQAEDTGKVLIRRKDGRTFALTPEKKISSPYRCSIN